MQTAWAVPATVAAPASGGGIWLPPVRPPATRRVVDREEQSRLPDKYTFRSGPVGGAPWGRANGVGAPAAARKDCVARAGAEICTDGGRSEGSEVPRTAWWVPKKRSLRALGALPGDLATLEMHLKDRSTIQ